MSVVKKKIVFALPALCAGGAERVVVTLLNNIDRSLFEVHLVSLQDGRVRDWVSDDVVIHILDCKRIIHSFAPFYKKLKEIKPDIVMSSIVHMNALVLLLKVFFPRTFFIVRESSLPRAMASAYGWKSRFCKYIYKFLYPRAHVVVCPSHQISKEFQDAFQLKRFHHQVLFNPIDEARVISHIPDPLPEQRQSQSIVRFVAVGRLTFEKAYDDLIEKLGQSDMGDDWRLDIIGGGGERARLEQMIDRSGLEKHIFLHGHLENPWAFNAQADAFLLCSLWEGMPNAALEALVCGAPVIATETAGGILEVAELAPDHVRIAQDMDGFIALMKTVRPQAKKSERVSLLPKEFRLDTVIQEFEALLEIAG